MRLLPGLCAGLLALALSTGAAFAQGSITTLPVTNASHGTTQIAGQQDATGNYHYRNVLEGLKSDGTPVAVTVDGSDSGLWMHVVNWPGSFSISNLPSTQVVSDSALETSASAIATNTNGAAKDGTDATGVTAPTGATGIRGWLSGTYNLLKGTLTFKPVDSGGVDATDPTNHAIKINCVTGCSAGSSAAACTNSIAESVSGAVNDVIQPTNKAKFCVEYVGSPSSQQTVSIIEGTGANCAGTPRAIYGDTTADAAHGAVLFAGQAYSIATSSPSDQTQTNQNHVCVLIYNSAGTITPVNVKFSWADAQ
jgi:hypothetical protein